MRHLLVLVVTIMALAGCDGGVHHRAEQAPTDSTRMTSPSIETVLAAHTPKLMSIPGVVGTAQGEEQGAPCILVFVVKKDERIRREIPSSLEGYPVRIDEVGEIRPIR